MGMMNLRSAAFVLITTLLPAQSGQIQGKVTAGTKPVANVKINVSGAQVSTSTRLDGTYTLMGLNPGSYTISASSPHYWPVSQADVQTGKMANFQLVEKRYLKNTSTGLVVADISMENVQQVLNAAENAGDIQSEYLIVNRLLEEQSGNDLLKQRSESLKQVLDSQRAQIGGKVVDAQGETLPNADVKITNQTTGAVFQTKTNDRGQYQLSVFPAGEYKIDVAKNGAQSSAQIHGAISPNATVKQDLSLSSVNAK
jgi:Carboxypeptidase regulatory-like domain